MAKQRPVRRARAVASCSSILEGRQSIINRVIEPEREIVLVNRSSEIEREMGRLEDGDDVQGFVIYQRMILWIKIDCDVIKWHRLTFISLNFWAWTSGLIIVKHWLSGCRNSRELCVFAIHWILTGDDQSLVGTTGLKSPGHVFYPVGWMLWMYITMRATP